MATAPARKKNAVFGRSAAEPSHPVHVARSGDVDGLARPEEEERLEEAVVDDVEEAAGEAEERPLRVSRRAPREAGPEAEDDDPDVLDAVPGQEALEVVLAESEGDAEDGGGGAQDEERVAPGGRRVGNERGDADDPVDPRLDEDARHERRDVRRGRGVRRREPDVKREESRLQAEPDEREDEEGRPRVRPGDARRERDELRRAREGTQEREEAEENEGGDVRREDVEPARVAGFPRLPVGPDEEEGGEGHHLPRREEEEDVSRDEDEGDRTRCRAEEEAGPARVGRVGLVAEGAGAADGREGRDEKEGHEEEGREGIETDVECGARQRPRARERLDVSGDGRDPRTDEAEERAADGAAGRDPPRGRAGRKKEPGNAAGRADEGSGENEEEAHRGGNHPRTTLHDRSATSVPRT